MLKKQGRIFFPERDVLHVDIAICFTAIARMNRMRGMNVRSAVINIANGNG